MSRSAAQRSHSAAVRPASACENSSLPGSAPSASATRTAELRLERAERNPPVARLVRPRRHGSAPPRTAPSPVRPCPSGRREERRAVGERNLRVALGPAALAARRAAPTAAATARSAPPRSATRVRGIAGRREQAVRREVGEVVPGELLGPGPRARRSRRGEAPGAARASAGSPEPEPLERRGPSSTSAGRRRRPGAGRPAPSRPGAAFRSRRTIASRRRSAPRRATARSSASGSPSGGSTFRHRSRRARASRAAAAGSRHVHADVDDMHAVQKAGHGSDHPSYCRARWARSSASWSWTMSPLTSRVTLCSVPVKENGPS